jgi:hypothetical protein
MLRAVGKKLDMRLDVVPRWRGGELDRLLASGHSAMHDAVARLFAELPDWTAEPEVTFNIFGERGAIDVLAWHPRTRTLLLIELKTELVDVQELLGSLHRKVRLAKKIVEPRGWRPRVISSWVIFAEGMTNRRRVEAHETVLRHAFPRDGRAMRAWLRNPAKPMAGLSFLSSSHRGTGRSTAAPVRRVRTTASRTTDTADRPPT